MFENAKKSLNDFKFLKKIGEGSFSEVYKAKKISNDMIYALKIEKENSLNEVRILASLNNPQFIIGYKDAFIDESSKSLAVVMEYANGGDLQKVIRNYKSKLKFIPDGLGNTQTGTPYFASPEVWREENYDIKNDIWALGCILYEMSAQSPPFLGKDVNSLFKNIQKGFYKKIPDFYSNDLGLIISKCLKMNAKERPNCKELLNDNIVYKNAKKFIEKSEENSDEILEILETIRLDKGNRINEKFPKPQYENINTNKNIFIQDNLLIKSKDNFERSLKENNEELKNLKNNKINLSKRRNVKSANILKPGNVHKSFIMNNEKKSLVQKVDKINRIRISHSAEESKAKKIEINKKIIYEKNNKNEINDKNETKDKKELNNKIEIKNEKYERLNNNEINENQKRINFAHKVLNIYSSYIKNENKSLEKKNEESKKKIILNVFHNESKLNNLDKKKIPLANYNSNNNLKTIQNNEINKNLSLENQNKIKRNLFNIFQVKSPNENLKPKIINDENIKIGKLIKNQSQILNNIKQKNYKPKFFIKVANPQNCKIKTEFSQNESFINRKIPICPSKNYSNKIINQSEIRIKTENSPENLNNKYKKYKNSKIFRRNLSSLDNKNEKKNIELPLIAKNRKNRPNSSNFENIKNIYNIKKNFKSPQNLISNSPVYQKLISDFKSIQNNKL